MISPHSPSASLPSYFQVNSPQQNKYRVIGDMPGPDAVGSGDHAGSDAESEMENPDTRFVANYKLHFILAVQSNSVVCIHIHFKTTQLPRFFNLQKVREIV